MKKYILGIFLSLITPTLVFAYNPSIPKSNAIASSDVNDAQAYSPINLNNDFTVFDHIGHKDTAFNGERHIATNGTGIHWYGYDSLPNNDMLLTNKNIPEDYTLNLKQTSIVADWHTINGSGVIFNASTDAPPNSEVATSSAFNFRGYALVATQDKIELRKYNTSASEFMSGSKNFEVVTSIPKTCNSQSFTINKKGNLYTLKLDNTFIYEGELEYIGNHVGAMVDYLEHNCTSLSSVYMYNLTVNGENLFKTGGES